MIDPGLNPERRKYTMPNKSRQNRKAQQVSDARAGQSPVHASESIRRRAHEIYCDRVNRGAGGDALSDWLQAERELNVEPRRKRS
jgi:hypothetical protein